MVTVNSTHKVLMEKGKRAADKLDLAVYPLSLISLLHAVEKKSVAKMIAAQVVPLTEQYKSLQKELETAMQSAKKSLFARIASYRLINKIKAQLNEVNQKIVRWVNATTRYFEPLLAGMMNTLLSPTQQIAPASVQGWRQ